ncbi:MAG TPA: hypothetical protein VIT68_05140 [Candidatus Gracilibacteria bacterium]
MFDWLKKLFGKKDQKLASCCGGGCCGETLDKLMSFDFGLSDRDREQMRAIDDLVVIGKVVEIRSHADATITKVKVTICDLGNGEMVQILCGGVNLEEGQVVPVARVNATLPGDFQIGERDIRGEMSYGMICASKELGLEREEEDKYIWPLPLEAERFLGMPLNRFV